MLQQISTTKLLACIFLLLLIIWGCYQWKYRRILLEARKLYPSKYKPLPFIGHVHHIVWRGWEGATKMFMDMIEDALEKDIDTLCLWIGPFPYILVLGTSDIQKVLTSSVTSEKPDEMEYFKYAGGNGLLTAPNEIWRVSRRHINPLFHPRNLARLMPACNRTSRALVGSLAGHAGGAAFDVFPHTLGTALQTVCHLIFGSQLEIDFESEMFQNLLIAVESIPDLFLKKLAKPWLRIEKIFETVYRKELKNINYVLRNFTALCIKNNRENKNKLGAFADEPMKALEKDATEMLNDQAKNPLTLIDVFNTMQSQYPHLTEQNLRDEVATLYATGSDTIAASVATCLVALGQNPDIQEKLFQEIREVMQDDADVTVAHLAGSPYLDQVFKETLRWSCLVPLVGRKPSEDLRLSSCTVAAGSTVAVVIAGAHMDPRTYPEPKVFNPDRFSPENSNGKGKYSYLPFSGGPRNCIGKEYSNMLFKTIIIHLLREFEVSTEMDLNTMKRKYMVVLIGSEGYKIKLQRRRKL